MAGLGRIYWQRTGLRWLAVLAAAWLAAGLLGTGGSLAVLAGEAASGRPGPDGPGRLLGPAAAIVLPGLLLGLAGAAALIQRSQDRLRRDPRRQFSREQLREGLDRAGGTCELEAAYRRRCARAAAHGIHFLPWSCGGSTTMENFVAACSRHRRLWKFGLPSPAVRRRLEERRRGYFPAGVPVAAGERNPVSGRAPAWLSG